MSSGCPLKVRSSRFPPRQVFSRCGATIYSVRVLLYVPVQDIGMVFDHKNAWANIQRKGRDLSYVEIDLNNSKLWKPFFTPEFTRDMDTCQKDEDGGRELKYFQPNMKVSPTRWSTCSPHA